MIFDDIVSFVCRKIGQTDADSIDACGQFLTSRAETIWDSQPWRESLSIVALNLPNLPAWQSCPFLLIPAQIGRVMKVRFASTMTLESWETITTFDLAPQAFDQTGQPVSFSQMPSVVAQISGEGTGTTGVNKQVNILNGSENDQNDPTKTFTIEIERADGTIVSAVDRFMDSVAQSSVQGVFITKFNKTVTEGDVSLTTQDPGDVCFPIVGVNAPDTEMPRIQRIRMQPAPTGAGTVLVLGKRAFPGFSTGQQYTLANLDNALQDFVQADMLERDRQYAKAQAKIQSANTLVQLAFGLETRQAANERRIIPACISGFYAAATFGFGAGGGDKEYW